MRRLLRLALKEGPQAQCPLCGSADASRAGELPFPHLAIEDGDNVTFAGLTLSAVAAPGHTFEHVAYLLLDESKVAKGAFTGGALLMASVGRSDLLGL